jgi:hypothetical protein
MDAVMSIFGKLSDPERAFQLANAVSAEGSLTWSDHIKNSDFPEILESAERLGLPVTITRSDSSDIFEQTRVECREAGLSYVITFGETGNEGYSDGISWRPAMDQEFTYILDGANPALRAKDVKKAAEIGIGAVNALVSELIDASDIGKIEIEPGLMDAYREYAGYEQSSLKPGN